MAYRSTGGGWRPGPPGSGGQGGAPLNFMSRITPGVMYLLIANAAFFFLSVFLAKYMVPFLGLVPGRFLLGFQFWRVVTYLFIHADFSHLFFNMLTVFFFGPALEQVWGTKKFLIYYFITGVGAGLVCAPVYFFLDSPNAVIIGASGACFGLLAAFALIYPNAIIYLMFMVPVRAKWLVLFFVLMEIAATASSIQGSPVASLAHVAGAVIGYLYLRRLMDLKAYWRSVKMRRRQKAYRVIDNNPDRDQDQRGPYLH